MAVKIPKWAKILSRTLVAVFCLIFVTAWAFFRFVLGEGPMARCAGHQQFDRIAWSDSAQAFGPLAVRGCMVDELMANHDFRGRHRASIVGLLGEPPSTKYFKEYDLVYWLGPERSLMSIDSEWLVMRLDSSSRVTEVRILTD